MRIGGIYAEIRARRDKLKGDLKKAKTEVERSAIKMEMALTSAFKTGFAAAGIAAVGLGAAFASSIKSGIKTSAELERRMLRTEAIIKATGNAARFTGKEFLEMAERLDLATLSDRDSLLDAINAMQTFRSVSGETFERAIELSVDLAEVLGTDLRSQVVQLGKALEDPITGLTALRRVGVTFNEQQKEQIKTLTESNKMLEAQGLILDAIDKQVGGAGSAAAGGLAGKVDTLQFRWRDFNEALANFTTIGAKVQDIIVGISDALGEMSDRMRGPGLREQLETEIQYWQSMISMYYTTGGHGGTDPQIALQKIQDLRRVLFQMADQKLGMPASPGKPKQSDFFLDYAQPAPQKLPLLDIVNQTEVGITGAERGHMAQVEMNRALVESIQLQNALAKTIEDTYDIDAGVINDFGEQVTETFTRIDQLTMRTAEKMQDNFSDVFYDAITGELSSLADYANAIFQSIARAWSDMMGQMVAQQLFGQAFQGGGLLSQLFSGGGGPQIIGLGGRAAGGPVYPGQTYLVGERGPELLSMGSNSGHITPNNAIGGGSNVTININAVDAKSVNQLFTERKGLLSSIIGSEAGRNGGLRTAIKRAAR